ncbi:MAG: CsgG/HfaB family protein [Firmicutes bacterium]|nr:CsgG/HfaB family protein [Bacillota bacterium]
MRRLLTLVITASLTLGAFIACPAAAQPDNRITVAVLDFKMGDVYKWWTWNWDVSGGVTALVTDALVGKGQYRIVERSRITQVLGEQDFGQSGRVDESSAVEIGKLLGARVLVYGTVTEFNFASTGGIKIGGVGLGGSKARTKLSGRVVDAQTGEILGSIVGEGEETGLSFSLNTYRGISFSAKEFKDSTVGKSVEKAVNAFAEDAVGKINAASMRLTMDAYRPALTGFVAGLIPNGVIINIGSNAGVMKNQYFDVFRVMVVAGVAEPVRVPVGVIKIVSVDPNAAVGMFESVTSPVQVGDAVAKK